MVPGVDDDKFSAASLQQLTKYELNSVDIHSPSSTRLPSHVQYYGTGCLGLFNNELITVHVFFCMHTYIDSIYYKSVFFLAFFIKLLTLFLCFYILILIYHIINY